MLFLAAFHCMLLLPVESASLALHMYVLSYICYFFQGWFMLFIQVTSVGINTEWGLLMASISEDTGEETPLQVSFVL